MTILRLREVMRGAGADERSLGGFVGSKLSIAEILKKQTNKKVGRILTILPPDMS